MDTLKNVTYEFPHDPESLHLVKTYYCGLVDVTHECRHSDMSFKIETHAKFSEHN